MESGIKRTQRDYTLAFKLAVVEQVEKGELTYKQAQQRYGIQGRSTVLVWLRKHGRLGWSPAASSAAMPVTIPRQSRGHSGCEPLEAAARGRLRGPSFLGPPMGGYSSP